MFPKINFKFYKPFVFLIFLVFINSSCGKSNNSKIITLASSGKIESLDPARINTIKALQVISSLGDTLYEFSKDGQLIPKLASDMPVFSEDKLKIYINLRDDVSGNVTKLVGEQVQKQFDFLEQASASAGIDYKFITRFEILDGGNGIHTPNILDTFELYGCYLESANYNTLNYATNEPVTVSLSIRYDNAIQTPADTGIGTAIGRTLNTAVTGGGA